MNEKAVCDLLAGDNYGNIFVITDGKCMIGRKNAHDKMINCMKVTTVFQSHIIIITAGEDTMIKMWDTKFNLINYVDLKELRAKDSISILKN